MQANWQGEWINSVSDAKFSAAVGDDISLEIITFNELCYGVANGEIEKFRLVMTSENNPEIEDTEVGTEESNALTRFARAIVTFINKILRLFKR